MKNMAEREKKRETVNIVLRFKRRLADGLASRWPQAHVHEKGTSVFTVYLIYVSNIVTAA